METITIVVIVVSLLILIPIAAWIIWSFIEVERIDARVNEYLQNLDIERTRKQFQDHFANKEDD